MKRSSTKGSDWVTMTAAMPSVGSSQLRVLHTPARTNEPALRKPEIASSSRHEGEAVGDRLSREWIKIRLCRRRDSRRLHKLEPPHVSGRRPVRHHVAPCACLRAAGLGGTAEGLAMICVDGVQGFETDLPDAPRAGRPVSAVGVSDGASVARSRSAACWSLWQRSVSTSALSVAPARQTKAHRTRA